MFAKVLVPTTLLLAASSVHGLNYARDGDWFPARAAVEQRDVMQQRDFSGHVAKRDILEERDLLSDIESAVPGLLQLLPPDVQGPLSSLFDELKGGSPTPAPVPTPAGSATVTAPTAPPTPPAFTPAVVANGPASLITLPTGAPQLQNRDLADFFSKIGDFGNGLSSFAVQLQSATNPTSTSSSSSASSTSSASTTSTAPPKPSGSSTSSAASSFVPYTSVVAVLGGLLVGVATVF
ncbi:hypothetical protein BXZ70DRAFT_946924 [Cristinia sonorae]|uniref:Uncharacterized protein n=1 Tax=Cristinia sonorae TaxID=1940300 RepID=A0A8K0UK41_9AGAR|nr:hypothetical protein BXZ70DRAFT_946924 [Cristinia sonorae]